MKTERREFLRNSIMMVVCLIATTALSMVLNRMGIGKENTLMIFLLGVLGVTVLTTGYIYGIISSVLSLLLFNFFFTEPVHTLIITHAQDYMLILFFFIASLITGTLSSKFRMQSAIAVKNGRTAKILYDISESFLHLSGVENILRRGVDAISNYTGYDCVAILDQRKFDGKALIYETKGYRMTQTPADSQATFQIQGMATSLGSIRVASDEKAISADKVMLIRAISYQLALALDREFIYTERERIKIEMESEHIRSTLLRSISHDLRTPLTGIIGASSLIMDNGEQLDQKDIEKLATDINEEATWLFNSVQNILDMTRITDKNIVIKKDFEVIEDVIEQAINQLPWLKKTNRLKVMVPDDIVLVKMDGRLMVQVLVNLLDNANKHTHESTEIELIANISDENLIITVKDNGPGVDKAILSTMFDSFVTLPRNVVDGHHGFGLGLAICKTIVEAHGGTIEAEATPGKGSAFTIKLPIE